MSTTRAWFPYRKGADDVELFAFPHVGAGSTVFSVLRSALSGTGVALIPAVLPGRERRLREEPHQDMDSLLAEFEDMAVRDGFSAFTGTYALLGHCSGALVAFEIARLLERSPCPNPQLLVVCSSLPPSLIRDTGMSRLPTRDLLARTAAMGGIPDALMADPDFVDMMMRPLRADWSVVDRYVDRADSPLTTPILAIRGTGDPDVSAADLAVWRDQTSGGFSTVELESGHWAISRSGSAELAQAIPAALHTLWGAA